MPIQIQPLSFDGKNARVVIADSGNLDLAGAWTITAWVFVNKSETGHGTILAKREDEETSYSFRVTGSGDNWNAVSSEKTLVGWALLNKKA